MFIYILITLILSITSFWEVFTNPSKSKTKYILYLLSSFLWALSFLRWDTGTDWDPYLDIFKSCNYIDWYEWGFLMLNRIIKNTVNNYSLLLAILGTILFLFQTKAINSLGILPLTTLFILWGTNLGNVFFVRQSVAVAILLYSITLIDKKNLKGFLLLIGIATSIHGASLAFLPAYWIYSRNFTIKQIVIALIASISLGSVGGTFIWGNLGSLLGGAYAAKIDSYTAAGMDGEFNSGMSGTTLYIRSVIGKLILIIPFWILISKEYKEKVHGMMNLFLFATVMLPITSSISPVLGRMWTPYFQVQVFLMAFVIASIRRFPYKMLCFSFFIIITIIRLYLKIFVDYDGEAYLPLKTILSL